MEIDWMKVAKSLADQANDCIEKSRTRGDNTAIKVQEITVAEILNRLSMALTNGIR